MLLQLRGPTKCFHWFWITTPIYPILAKSCIHTNISFMILPPLQKYSPKGLLFHHTGDLKTFKTFFHAPVIFMIVALTSVVALNAKVNVIFVAISKLNLTILPALARIELIPLHNASTVNPRTSYTLSLVVNAMCNMWAPQVMNSK